NPVLTYIDVMFEWVRKFPAESSVIIYFYYLCSTQAAVAIPNRVFLEKARLRIEALLHESIGRGIYKPVDDPATLALQIHTLILGACMVIGTHKNNEEFNTQVKLCKETVKALVDKA